MRRPSTEILSLKSGNVPSSTSGPLREKIWREFFSDPSQWWDSRSEKANWRYPDFKHKKTRQALWVIDCRNPPWVEAALAAVTPGILHEDRFTWNNRLASCVKAGQYEKTMELFQQMIREGLHPNMFTFVPALNACASLGDLKEGRRIHEQITQCGFESDVFAGNSLIHMYSKCGNIEDAWRVFTKMPTRNILSWTAMILGYLKSGQGRKALDLYQQMQQERVRPERATIVGVLNACASVGALEEGRCIHEEIMESGWGSHANVATSLVDMYAKCGSVEDARRVFDNMPKRDAVAWTAMIGGYVKCKQGQKALEVFRQMTLALVEPDPVTFVAVLNACADVEALEEGRRVHAQIVQSQVECNVLVSSSLVDMYAKCGSIQEAWTVFNTMTNCDVVAWNAMIVGYVKCGKAQKALELFRQMEWERVEPNPVSFVGLLNACASLAALEEGRGAHQQIIQRGYESDIIVANSLVDMYAKCGSIEDAQRVFSRMPSHNVVTWNTLLAGFSIHGHGKEAIQHFEAMHQAGVEINEITFVSLLSACNHGGWMDEGLYFFEFMRAFYNIPPTFEHNACVVDLLGRSGRLHEAEALMETILNPNVDVWKSLLGACRIHGNMEMGENIAKQVLEFAPENSAGYVLLQNIYATAGKWV